MALSVTFPTLIMVSSDVLTISSSVLNIPQCIAHPLVYCTALCKVMKKLLIFVEMGASDHAYLFNSVKEAPRATDLKPILN